MKGQCATYRRGDEGVVNAANRGSVYYGMTKDHAATVATARASAANKGSAGSPGGDQIKKLGSAGPGVRAAGLITWITIMMGTTLAVFLQL